MSPAEAAIREALAALSYNSGAAISLSIRHQVMENAPALLSELDALRLELENSKATEASLRARCEAGEALLREALTDRRIIISGGDLHQRIDAHLKGASRE